MYKVNKKPRNEEMYKAILQLQSLEECENFFDDLCTVTELQAMEQRYEVAACLDKGMITAKFSKEPVHPLPPYPVLTGLFSTARAVMTLFLNVWG